MQLSSRDIEMLIFVNRFYFAKSETLFSQFFPNVKTKSNFYKRLRFLQDSSFLKKTRVNNDRILMLGPKGEGLLKSIGRYIPIPSKISEELVHHNSIVGGVASYLSTLDSISIYSEAELISIDPQFEILPDILVRYNGFVFHIEVELSVKPGPRIKDKFFKFSKKLNNQKQILLYLTDNKVVFAKICRIIREEGMGDFIKVLFFDEFKEADLVALKDYLNEVSK